MQKGDLAGLVIVVAMLVGIALFFVLAKQAPKVIYAPTEIAGSEVTVGELASANSVKITAEIKQAGFVAIHQAIGEAPGPIVGQSELLAAGSYVDFVIEATESLEPPAEHFILLFVDDGDGVFESGIDLPVMSDGQVIKRKLNL